MNIYEQARHNKNATWVMLGVFILFFLFLGFGVDAYYGLGSRMPVFTGAAFLFGLISGYGSFQYGDKFVLASCHARPLDLQDPAQAQWQNVVEEMSIASGLPQPKTYIIDDLDPNAFATGKSPQEASIVVTRGLLNALNREELQGVAAHEMSHVKNYDTRLMLILAVLVGAVALISDWAGRGFLRGRRRSSSGEGAGILVVVVLIVWVLAVILAPILSQLLAMCVSRKREYLADASGAGLTRNPLALASALEKIENALEPTQSINQGTAHLCIADPKGHPLGSKEGSIADLFATHPPIQKRIEALRHMAYAA